MKKQLFSVLFLATSCFSQPLNIDQYLKESNIKMTPGGGANNEGFMTKAQSAQFINHLKTYKNIEYVYEIGLNGGHSACLIINQLPELKKFVSFDINWHPYTPHAASYIQSVLGDRFEFVAGDSRQTVPVYISNQNQLADLIYIDGNHSYEGALQDILNMHSASHPNTILWIDDVPENMHNDVAKAVLECVKNKIIKIKKIHASSDPNGGYRSWVEACYIH